MKVKQKIHSASAGLKLAFLSAIILFSGILFVSKVKVSFQEYGFALGLGVLLVCCLIGLNYYNGVQETNHLQYLAQFVMLMVLFNSPIFSPIAPFRKIICKARPNFTVFGLFENTFLMVSNKVYFLAFFICLAISFLIFPVAYGFI